MSDKRFVNDEEKKDRMGAGATDKGPAGAGKDGKARTKASAAPGAVVAILLALGLGGYGLGTAIGNGNSAANASGSAASEAAESVVSTADVSSQEAPESEAGSGSEAEKVLRVEVQEDKILVDGAEVSLEDLPGILQEAGASAFVLSDAHARKETYDAVKDALAAAGLNFSEE